MKKYLIGFLFLLTFCSNTNNTTNQDTQSISDADSVILAYYDLTYADIQFTIPDTEMSVTQDFIVPLSGTNGTSISWSSVGVYTNIINNYVTVIQPIFGSGNQAVFITATITKGSATIDKLFLISVNELPPVIGNTKDYLISASFTMVYMEPKTTFTLIDDSGSATVTRPFLIDQTEVTYLQWLEVRIWAEANGYVFANPGTMGDGSGDTDQHPVTFVNWRDTIVWTNALTEYYNAQKGTNYNCVYTSDASFNNCLRTSSSNASIDTTAGSIDNPFVNPDAKGFRLPTRDEWELSARYISDLNNDGDIHDIGEYYPGSHISGDSSADYLNSGVIDNYAWNFNNSSSSTHIVKTKTANALGLYDMTGNVNEWCFDWDVGFVNQYRVYRGGSWNLTPVNLQLGKVKYQSPNMISAVMGFRIAQSY